MIYYFNVKLHKMKYLLQAYRVLDVLPNKNVVRIFLRKPAANCSVYAVSNFTSMGRL